MLDAAPKDEPQETCTFTQASITLLLKRALAPVEETQVC